MIRSMDTLISNMHVLQKRQEVTSSNIANVETPGYQGSKLFQSTLREIQLHNYQNGAQSEGRQELGGLPFANQIDSMSISTDSAAVRETQRTTDFSIQNGGYFVVRMANGQEAFTRNGNFKLDAQNQLVTQEGYFVLGKNNQPVTEQNWQDMQVRQFDSTQGWTMVGNTYFTSTDPGQVNENSVIRQGELEGSNVSVSDEMVSMIEINREFEANQKALSTVNETLKKATNELGKI